ncbi:uncharacterized protein LOC106155430 [Lingula anatina]|uniref:Uncharacterized protein LOC106155430 n=1 Tax=Lingula anatina TaxID=7574 RepID=A0A1S3HK00_LINAN|nr:uncharacterized protein LOC106155430 [Lingula anatina]|eukprot:XP_013385781.1 uncharacterized protein LOC106155430 [Lingula anatina]
MTISPIPPCIADLKPYFTKYLNVFGVHIVAVEDIPDTRVRHTANIMAEYLDNDGDGKVDNKAIVSKLIENKALFSLFRSTSQMNTMQYKSRKSMAIFKAYKMEFNLFKNDEYLNESDIDFTLEETLHLITGFGFAFAFPAVFGENSGSTLGKITLEAIADCGLAYKHTYKWPYCKGVYHYKDPTCKMNCLTSELIYWGLTSILGIQKKPVRAAYISNEWELYNKLLLRTKLPQLYHLLTDPKYRFPTVAPVGHYGNTC